MNYYNKNAKKFYENTVNADMTPHYKKFLENIQPKCHILDAGCGSGRDTLHFTKLGYTVTAIDSSHEMCKLATQHTKQDIQHIKIQDITYNNQFDAIWASASLLHIKPDQLDTVLTKLHKSLKKDGILYASFKHGNYHGIRNGRYFHDITQDKAQKIFTKNNYKIIDTWITTDVRKDRNDEKWVNILARKQ